MSLGGNEPRPDENDGERKRVKPTVLPSAKSVHEKANQPSHENHQRALLCQPVDDEGQQVAPRLRPGTPGGAVRINPMDGSEGLAGRQRTPTASTAGDWPLRRRLPRPVAVEGVLLSR